MSDDALLAIVQEIAAFPNGTSTLPVRQSFAIAGTFRVYFNRHQAAPLVWCVALGEEFELAVADLTIEGATVRTVYQPKATPDDEDGKPRAWLEVHGVLSVAGGQARISEEKR